VNGLPSCHFTPRRSFTVNRVRDASHAQLSARSGTIVSNPLRGFNGSNISRLLKTAENGIAVAIVAPRGSRRWAD
jgi:hypothetical protein